MAVIGSIRKRGTLLLIVIGVSMLAFILGSNIFTNLMGGPDNTVAEIDGKKINIAEYQTRLANKEARYIAINPQIDMNESQRQQIGDEVWNEIINERVFFNEFEKLGIAVSKVELQDMMVGRSVHNMIKSQFANKQTGAFNPQDVATQLAQLEDESAVPEENLEQWKSVRAYWGYMQEFIKQDRIQSKYRNLISKSTYLTKKEVEGNYKSMGEKANMRMVMKSYASVPDSTIKVSDDELKKYYDEFGYRFRNSNNSRGIKYVVFSGIPTQKDSADILLNINILKTEFITSADDSLFVNQNSDNSTAPQYYKANILNKNLDSALFNSPIGSVAGPIIENGYYVIAKKMGEKSASDSCKARHILLQPQKQEDVEPMRKLRDSLLVVLKNGGDFAAIAAQYSNDESNKRDTGNLGWFTEGMMVKSFNDSAFAAKPGQYKLVDSEFGFHILYVQNQTKPIRRMLGGLVSKLIQPSSETMEYAYNQASEIAFIDKSAKDFNSEKYFDNVVKSKKLMAIPYDNITDDARNVGGLEESKEVIKWSLNAKRGDISDVFKSGNNYVVAILSSIRTVGIPKLEDIKKEVEIAAIRHKKAEMFMKEFSDNLSKAKNIDALATNMKLNVVPATDINFLAPFIPGAGKEAKVVGALFGLKQGKLSVPIEGDNGVYVIIKDSSTPAPPTGDLTLAKTQMISQLSSGSPYQAMEAVKSIYKIKDRRYNFDMN
jgi:peptidyl-prolyl cis-trans isomerase D